MTRPRPTLRLAIVPVLALVLALAPARLRAEDTDTETDPATGPVVELVLGAWLPDETPGRALPGAEAAVGRLEAPFGVAFRRDGSMIVVELEGGRVHLRAPDGRFETIAGNGRTGYSGDGGPARDAVFNGMHNVAVDPRDRVYIADTWNHVVRRVDPETGRVETVAGTGEPGFSGDGGPARLARFHDVMCVTLDPEAAVLHVADLRNRRIRAIDLAAGTVSTVAGNGERGAPTDGARAVDAPLVDPRAAAADARGLLYVLERGGHALRLVRPDGTIATVAGTGQPGWRDGPASEAMFNAPKHLCVDPAGRVYVADDENAAIRRYDPDSRRVDTVLGRGRGNPPVRLAHPHGVTVRGEDLYVVDTRNNRVLRLPGAVRP